MKPLTLIFLLYLNSCMGQYPLQKAYPNNIPEPFFYLAKYQDFDSSKFYWKKQIYWENKMNAELERLNNHGHANDISKALLRYQDSAIKYKILLDRFKK